MHPANTISILSDDGKIAGFYVKANIELLNSFSQHFELCQSYEDKTILLRNLWLSEHQAEIIENQTGIFLRFTNELSRTVFLMRFS